ncbi:unnamed protein product [Prunus armeniaca]|uniref:Retrotransposon gag domain-containing protein n=1 Tax=Prunus armeniaca TaxID=36596 RepID=A0A6J5Y8K4_PRUAR|nr:unnamed protein product [Prunus armeniaca]
MKRMQDEMDQKLELRLIALERERGPGPLDLVTTTDILPFSRDILEFKLPKDFKQPRMQLYDGTTDPVDLLNDFGYWMNVKDVGDAMKCWAFPLLLEGSAKDWFKSLKPDSISLFDLLKQSFVNQFLSISKKRYPPNYLLSIRQGAKEKSRGYINRFNREVISIPSCSKDTAYTALLGGFRRGPFLFHVNKFPPKSYEDLVFEVYCHAIAEEMTYDTPEGKDQSQPGVGDKRREDWNDVREKPDYKKGRFENSRRGGRD